ncbi:unnamed protein product, partial [Mesorhabditis belari]|uniref:Neurotransmitter-gated ion-channel transmembrane domain-containing protein n=1 Tax=Mesorhabditis belari TaxID=2138241 RepID=A0AAF3F5F8_9BILA
MSLLPARYLRIESQEGTILFSKYTQGLTDWDPPIFGGWRVIDSSQKMAAYDPKTRELTLTTNLDYSELSALSLSITIKRYATARALLAFLPILIATLLLLVSWIAPSPVSSWMAISTLIFLSTVVRDVSNTVPRYDNQITGFSIVVILLWISTPFSLVIHQIFSLSLVQRESVRLIPLLEKMPLFSRLEQFILKTETLDPLRMRLFPPQIFYIQLIIAALHLIVIPILLF